jgi:hypothetical protein
METTVVLNNSGWLCHLALEIDMVTPSDFACCMALSAFRINTFSSSP